MSSRIRSSLATMVCPHRYTVFLIVGLVVLVSSFSALLPTCGTNQNRNGFSSLNLVTHSHQQEQRRRTFYQSSNRSPLILSLSSSATTEDTQEARDLFSKYCDKNSLIDRKTLESIPPFADMLVSWIEFTFLKRYYRFHSYFSAKNSALRAYRKIEETNCGWCLACCPFFTCYFI